MDQQRQTIKSPIPVSSIRPDRLPPRSSYTDEVRDQSIRLYANHFRCEIADKIQFYQYDVDILEVDESRDEKTPIDSPFKRGRVMRELFPDDRLDGSIYIWYDSYNNQLYSRVKIETPRNIVQQYVQYFLVISKLVAEFSTHEIHRFINGESEIYPSETVRILELLLAQALGPKIRTIGKKCYFVGVEPRDAQGGLEQREGFIGALDLHSRLITWNVQRKDTYFYANISIQEFIRREINADRMPSENEFRRIQRKLHGCKMISTQRTDHPFYTFHRFSSGRPHEIRMNDRFTVEEYYQDRFGIVLQHRDYPCIETYVTNNNNGERCLYPIPLELCRIQKWQIYKNNILEPSDVQQNLLEPVDRYGHIMDIVYQCDFNRSPLCRDVQFTIDTREIITVDAHVIRRPRINVGTDDEANVSLGRILLNGRLFRSRPIRDLPIVYFGSNFDNDRKEIDRFEQELVAAMERVGMYDGHNMTQVDQIDRQSINECLQTLRDQNHKLVLCIVGRNVETQSDRLVADVKDLAATEHGLMTQFVNLSKIANAADLRTYCDNIVQQLNNKTAGINVKVQLDETITTSSYGSDSYMFFGADAINTKSATRENPSYTAVVASRDSLCSRSVNRISRQYPREGTCAIETIFAMKTMVTELMRFYSDDQTNLPTKVIFYRHGVQTDDFSKILDHEIPLIFEAFHEIYSEKKERPKLTYIVVQRDHHTRFFMYDHQQNETTNAEMGTVVDRTIVHPYRHDFYLNSHVALSGVNQPSLYHVLLNEIELTDDELHSLTYHLAFADPRSNATEAMPCVVHQAQKTTRKVQTIYRTLADAPVNPFPPLQNPTMDDIEYDFLDIHGNVKNQLLFA